MKIIKTFYYLCMKIYNYLQKTPNFIIIWKITN